MSFNISILQLLNPEKRDRPIYSRFCDKCHNGTCETAWRHETGIQDPQEAAQYAQQAIALVNEHANNNPQGLQSVFRRFLGGGL